MVNEVYKLQISCEFIFPIENVAHVRSHKTFYHYSVSFRNPGFCLVPKPQKPTTNQSFSGLLLFKS